MAVTYSIFPKFYKDLSLPELAALVRKVGLDTTHLVCRAGYWIEPASFAADLARVSKTLRDEGLSVPYLTADFRPDELVKDPGPLRAMADAGVTLFRVQHFRAQGTPVREALDAARAQMERLVPLCLEYGVRALYQVHHQTLYASASAAWMLVKGLPPAAVAVELDPGNQSYDGFEQWSYGVPLLGEYLAAVGVKDSMLRRVEEDGAVSWKRSWTTLGDGVNDWPALAKALKAADFDGVFEFMPFYDTDRPDVMTEKLAGEVAYLRGVMAEA